MSVTWLATRATGLVSLGMLSAVVMLGVAYAAGWGNRIVPRIVTSGLHRRLAILTLVFLVLHIGTTVIDGYVPVSWWDVVVPFGSAYQPLWIGLAALAFDLLLAIMISSWLRDRIGERAWTAIHWSAYACWALAAVHAVGVGSDRLMSLAVIGLGGVGILGVLAVRGAKPAAAPVNPPLPASRVRA